MGRKSPFGKWSEPVRKTMALVEGRSSEYFSLWGCGFSIRNRAYSDLCGNDGSPRRACVAFFPWDTYLSGRTRLSRRVGRSDSLFCVLSLRGACVSVERDDFLCSEYAACGVRVSFLRLFCCAYSAEEIHQDHLVHL